MNNELNDGKALVENKLPQLDSIGSLFKKSWQQYKDHFNVLASIAVISSVGLYLSAIVQSSEDLAWLSLIAVILYIVGLAWGTAAMFLKISKLDEPMDTKEAFEKSKKFVWPIFIASILVTVFVVLGIIFFLIPGILMLVWFIFTNYIIVAEKKRVFEAFQSSKDYVKGYWWNVLGRYIVISVTVGVIAFVIGFVVTLALPKPINSVVQLILIMAITPFSYLALFNIYKNLKEIKSSPSFQIAKEVEKED